MYVLLNLVKSIPTTLGLDAAFGQNGTVGCLLVFDTLESLREISSTGNYAVMEEIENAR